MVCVITVAQSCYIALKTQRLRFSSSTFFFLKEKIPCKNKWLGQKYPRVQYQVTHPNDMNRKKKRNHEAVTRFLSFIMWSVLSLAMFWSQAQSQQTLLAEMCPKCGHLSMYTAGGILINKCSNLILQKWMSCRSEI